MQRRQTLLQVFYWCAVVPHENLVSEPILAKSICLESISLCLVRYSLFILVLSFKSHCHFVNRKGASKHPQCRKDEVNPFQQWANLPIWFLLSWGWIDSWILARKERLEMSVPAFCVWSKRSINKVIAVDLVLLLRVELHFHSR